MKQFIKQLLIFFIGTNLCAQSIPTISKWIDDNNYLETRLEGLTSKSYKVNALTGQSTLYTETGSSIKLPDSLRTYSWGANSEHVYLIKKYNDLYLFDGALKQLTSDNAEEKVPQF